MGTTVAGTSCVVDVEAYKVGKDNTLGSDICATSATTINSLTFANKDFTITAGTLAAGDVLDIRITITVVDIRGDKVRLGIEAPSTWPVHRREVQQAIEREQAQ